MSNPIVHVEVVGEDAEALQSFYRDAFDWQMLPSGPDYAMAHPGVEGGINGGVGASPKACAQRSVDGLGLGVGKGRRGARLAEAPATARVRRPAAALSSGEDVFLDRPEQEDEQRLRAAAGDWSSLRLRGDESPDGEEISTLARLFGQFLVLQCHYALPGLSSFGFRHLATQLDHLRNRL